LNKRRALEPTVARRHAIRTGIRRCFAPTFANAASFRKLAQRSADARIVFFLAVGQGDRQRFSDEVMTYSSDLDVVVECLNA